MTKFEEIYAPATEPVTIANNANQALHKNHREWREAFHAVKVQNRELMDENKEFERENQRLKAENLSIKTLVEDAKQQPKVLQMNYCEPQQALPAVPECVAGAIESIPDYYSAFEAISLINAKVNALPEENEDWLTVYNWLCEDVENQDVFALAFITRKYQAERPQLFYLREKNTGYYLRKSGTDWYGITSHYSNDSDENYMNYKFTQQEIDKLDTGSYEQIEVAE